MPNLLVTEEQRAKNVQKVRRWRAKMLAENPEELRARQRGYERKYAERNKVYLTRKRRQNQKRAVKELRPYYVRDQLATSLRRAGMYTNPSDYPPELVDAWADLMRTGRLFQKKSKKLNNQTTKGLQ